MKIIIEHEGYRMEIPEELITNLDTHVGAHDLKLSISADLVECPKWEAAT